MVNLSYLKSKNKYVALDIGNVLVYADFDSFLKKLSKTINIELSDATYFLNRSQKLHDMGLTVMKDELKDHLKIKSPVIVDELVESWNDCIRPAGNMLEMFNSLRKDHNLNIALVSNIGLEHAARMESILSYGGFFDNATKHFSCHVGARKPTVVYFQSFLQLHPEWQGCPYVDDLQENLDASKQFGFRTHRFALSEITGNNYSEINFDLKMHELKSFVLGE